jgi:four helix bundle suffix protein
MSEPLIPKHGGYRRLKSFQLAQLCFDLTVRFCERYISRRSRTHDQMVQAARSGVQNIAEGSQASGTSKKTELKLTNVARASLEELRLDYEDFLRQSGLPLWGSDDPRRKSLVARRCATADQVADWVREQHDMPSIKSTYPELAANAALILLGVACALLDRQLAAQAAAFTEEGGFTERLYRIRTERRRQQ